MKSLNPLNKKTIRLSILLSLGALLVIIASFESQYAIAVLPPVTVKEWSVPSSIFLTMASDNTPFFTETGDNKIGQINPSTNILNEWPVPTASSAPLDIKFDSSSNLIWFTEVSGNNIGSLNPATNSFEEFMVPSASPGFGPRTLAVHSEKIFFTEAQTFGKAIGMLDPATGTFTEWDNPSPPWITQAISLDSSGNAYFTQLRTFVSGGDKIGKLDVSTNTFTVWTLPGDNTQPLHITVSSSGKIFATEYNGNDVIELDPATNVLTQFSLPLPSGFPTTGPSDLIVDASGKIELTERNANNLDALDPSIFSSTSIVLTPTITTITPSSATVTPVNTIVSLISSTVIPVSTSVPLSTPATGLTEFAVPTANSEPLGIVISPGGSIFATEAAGNKILSTEFALTSPPDCTKAAPSLPTMWPPNHKMQNIKINGVTDPSGGTVSIKITSIFQDEPVTGGGSGHTAPDGSGVGTDTAQVRAERDGTADGRTYHIDFGADDGQGGVCTGTVLVVVPHDQSAQHPEVDQGALYDSTKP